MAHMMETVSVQNEIQKTVDYMKTVVPEKATLDPDFKKTFDTSSGLQPYNLEPFLGTLVPILTPLRNSIPRVNGRGKQVEFKAVTAINTQKLNGFVAEGSSGQLVTSTVNDVNAVYRSIALADKVTYEQEWEGKPYVDSRALAVANLLRATMIAEESNILFAQNNVGSATQQAPGAVGTTPTPTLTPVASGGTLAAGSVYVKAVGFTGMGAAIVSAEATATVALNGSLTITPVFPANQPIVGFLLFAGSASGTNYQVAAANVANSTLLSDNYTTNGAPITLTSLPTSGPQASTYNADNSSSALAYNGILPQIFAGGGYRKAVNGKLTMDFMKALFKGLWDQGKGDPNVVYTAATESSTITDLTLGANNTPYNVLIDEQNGAAGGFRVSRLVNQITGTDVNLRVHPNLFQGTLMALQTELPGWYPGADIPSPVVVDNVQDYTEISYSPTYASPGWVTEVRLLSTVKLYIPLLQGVLYGITPGV